MHVFTKLGEFKNDIEEIQYFDVKVILQNLLKVFLQRYKFFKNDGLKYVTV